MPIDSLQRKRLESDFTLNANLSILNAFVIDHTGILQGLSLSSLMGSRVFFHTSGKKQSQHLQTLFDEAKDQPERYERMQHACNLIAWSMQRRCIEFAAPDDWHNRNRFHCDARRAAGLAFYLVLPPGRLPGMVGLFANVFLTADDALEVAVNLDAEGHFASQTDWLMAVERAPRTLRWERVSEHAETLLEPDETTNNAPLRQVVGRVLWFLASDHPQAARWRRDFGRELHRIYAQLEPFSKANLAAAVQLTTFTPCSSDTARPDAVELLPFERAELVKHHSEFACVFARGDRLTQRMEVGDRFAVWEEALRTVTKRMQAAQAEPQFEHYLCQAFLAATRFKLQEEKAAHPHEATVGLLLRLKDVLILHEWIQAAARQNCQLRKSLLLCALLSSPGAAEKLNWSDEEHWISQTLFKAGLGYLPARSRPVYAGFDDALLTRSAWRLATIFQADFLDFPRDVPVTLDSAARLTLGFKACLTALPLKTPDDIAAFRKTLQQAAVFLAQYAAMGAVTTDAARAALRVLHTGECLRRLNPRIQDAKAELLKLMTAGVCDEAQKPEADT